MNNSHTVAFKMASTKQLKGDPPTKLEYFQVFDYFVFCETKSDPKNDWEAEKETENAVEYLQVCLVSWNNGFVEVKILN